MGIFSRLISKKKEAISSDAPWQAAQNAKPPYLTQTVVFGMHLYRRAGDDSSVYFVDESRGIRKMLVDSEGRIQDFPGIVKEEFWVKEVSETAMNPQIHFRTSFNARNDGWIMLWEIQPDGRYWGDEHDFGMDHEEEVILGTFVNMDGCFTGPFRIYKMGQKHYRLKAPPHADC